MKIDNKQDVINWLKRLKDDHPLSVDECRLQNSDGSMTPEKHKVYTDQVIKNRYQDMIDYLESDEVTSGSESDLFDGHCPECKEDDLEQIEGGISELTMVCNACCHQFQIEAEGWRVFYREFA